MVKLSKANAMRLWEKHYGSARYAEDFHGYYMCREAYGDVDSYVMDHGERIYCGWNLHHILPAALGGTDDESNLVCTSINTNRAAGEKTTYWIDDCLYQVHRSKAEHDYQIIRLK